MGRKKSKFWSIDELKIIASRYRNRSELQKENKSAYNACVRLNVLDNLFPKTDKTRRSKYSIEFLVETALLYNTRQEFRDCNYNAWYASMRSGRYDVICSHMERQTGQANIIYIWELVGASLNHKSIFKIGITSKRLGADRFRDVANSLGSNYNIIMQKEIDTEKIFDLESDLLKIGTDVPFYGFNGSSEFRTMSKKELAKALKAIANNK